VSALSITRHYYKLCFLYITFFDISTSAFSTAANSASPFETHAQIHKWRQCTTKWPWNTWDKLRVLPLDGDATVVVNQFDSRPQIAHHGRAIVSFDNFWPVCHGGQYWQKPKRLSCRRGTARRSRSVENLSAAVQEVAYLRRLAAGEQPLSVKVIKIVLVDRSYT